MANGRGNFGRNLTAPVPDEQFRKRAKMYPAGTGISPQQTNTIAKHAYNSTRVYHGVHADNQTRINTQGLTPQGGKGMSEALNDQGRAAGHVFVTTDKDRAGYYAKVSSEFQIRRIKNDHTSSEEELDNAYDGKPEPQIMRAMLSPRDQKAMKKDHVGQEGDYMIEHRIGSRKMLPGDNTENVDMNQKTTAVRVLKDQMRKMGANVTDQQAGNHLQQLRRQSVGHDSRFVNSDFAVSAAKRDTDRANMFNLLNKK